MEISDAQVHIWRANSGGRPWRTKPMLTTGIGAQLGNDEGFLPERLLAAMDVAGVSRAIIVPPSFEGDRNDLAIEACRDFPERFGFMGRVDAEARNLREQLHGLQDRPGFLGVRLTFHRGDSVRWLRDGTADRFFRVASELDIPLFVYPPGQIESVRKLASAYPDLRLTVDHLGLSTDLAGSDVTAAIYELTQLAECMNVSVKASGLVGNSAESFPYVDLHAPIKMVLDAFGPERVFWGSDFTRIPGTYRQAVRLFTEELSFLSIEDQEWLMGRAVSRWLRWKPVEAAPMGSSSGAPPRSGPPESGGDREDKSSARREHI